jgi:hypothetical protein
VGLPWPSHASNEYAHQIIAERVRDDGSSFEELVRGMADGARERYDPVLARLRALEASGLDPFAEANR